MASQPKQQPRVNGNTFKNYNGKKIISIQNSYQKAQILKNQHNNSSGGIQQQASKAVGGSSHSRKRSEKENQRAAPGNSAYSKIQLRTQDKHDESQEQAAAADQQQEGDSQANQSANGGGGTQGFHSIVCQVPQNQAASLQQMQMQKLAHLQQLQMQQQQKAQAHGQGGVQQQEWLIGAPRKNDVGRKTLVLDLDETLVHSQFKPVEGADIVLPVEIEG